MEGDEVEMSREELQTWITAKVENKLISSDILEKCNMLQSLLQRSEKQAAELLKLYQSVAACEATVKKQYSLLGWMYRDTDSEDDDDKSSTGYEHNPPSPYEPVHSETKGHLSPAASGCTPLSPKLQDSENLNIDTGGKKVSLSNEKTSGGLDQTAGMEDQCSTYTSTTSPTAKMKA